MVKPFNGTNVHFFDSFYFPFFSVYGHTVKPNTIKYALIVVIPCESKKYPLCYILRKRKCTCIFEVFAI